jgi:hypothetical protein
MVSVPVWISYRYAELAPSRRRNTGVNYDHDGYHVQPEGNSRELANGSWQADRGDQHRPQTPASRLIYATARYRDRVLDGPRVWGSIDTGPDRHGFRRYRLVVFPPGVTRAQRRLLICLSQVYGPSWALAMATAAYLGGAAILCHRLGTQRTHVHTLSAVVIAGYSDPHAGETYAELQKLTAILCTCDALLGQGRISVADHELIWGQVYERVDQRGHTVNHASQ